MSRQSTLLTNAMQAALLFGAFLLASRDVDRTMRQAPVTEQQNRQMFETVEAARQRR
jgi:hypothetical protein